MMNIQDLTRCYYIQPENISKLQKLGLLGNIPIIDNQMKFDDESVRQIIEMIHLMELGIDDQNLINYCNNKDMQTFILKKIRIPILEQLHLYQKRLDDIDYLIYEKEKRCRKENI